MESETIQIVALVVAALAVLLQAIVLLAIFFTLRKATRSMQEDLADLRSSLKPILERTRELVTNIAPKLEAATTDLAATAHDLRSQTVEVQSSVAEIMDRLRHQAARLDAMASKVLNGVDHAAGFVTDTIAKPMRQFAALLASAKAVVDSLRGTQPAPAPRPLRSPTERPPSVKDMFV